ncbi:MAG: hypothetical protein IJI68_11755 [Eggerthellaceae bacterium]|nr:hypothetical protein [Eggerthellaceae bacterium]
MQVNQEFSSTVNKTLLTEVQKGVEEVGAETDKVRDKATGEIDDARSDLQTAIAMLDSASSSIGGWRESVAAINASLGETADQLPAIQYALDDSSRDLDILRAQVSEFDSEFSQTLAQANLTLANLSLRVSSSVGNATADVAKAAASLNEIAEELKVTIELHGNIAAVDELL